MEGSHILLPTFGRGGKAQLLISLAARINSDCSRTEYVQVPVITKILPSHHQLPPTSASTTQQSPIGAGACFKARPDNRSWLPVAQ